MQGPHLLLVLAAVIIIALVQPILGVSPAEQQALNDVYQFLDGLGWINNTNWLKGDPCQNGWYGVLCSPSGHVVSLILNDNNLQGKIPDSIGNLYNLQALIASSNGIVGSIPDAIGFYLHALEKLDLSHNELEGSIPESLGDLCNYYNLIFWICHSTI